MAESTLADMKIFPAIGAALGLGLGVITQCASIGAEPEKLAQYPALLRPTNGNRIATLIPHYEWDIGDYGPKITNMCLRVAKDQRFTEEAYSIFYGPDVWNGKRMIIQQHWNKNLHTNTTYFWRVTFQCPGGEFPSDTWSFSTTEGELPPPPAMLDPTSSGIQAKATVTLRWASVAGAKAYQVYIRKHAERDWSAHKTSQREKTWSLKPNTVYEWKVSTISDFAMGPSSEWWQFTTGPD